MKKILTYLLVLPLLFSCSDNDSMVNNEYSKWETSNIESPILEELVLDEGRRGVVWADLGGGFFGFLKGGWWGALVYGTLASLTQAGLHQPLLNQNISMDDFILNKNNPYEFIGISHYTSINNEFILNLSNYMS